MSLTVTVPRSMTVHSFFDLKLKRTFFTLLLNFDLPLKAETASHNPLQLISVFWSKGMRRGQGIKNPASSGTVERRAPGETASVPLLKAVGHSSL